MFDTAPWRLISPEIFFSVTILVKPSYQGFNSRSQYHLPVDSSTLVISQDMRIFCFVLNYQYISCAIDEHATIVYPRVGSSYIFAHLRISTSGNFCLQPIINTTFNPQHSHFNLWKPQYLYRSCPHNPNISNTHNQPRYVHTKLLWHYQIWE